MKKIKIDFEHQTKIRIVRTLINSLVTFVAMTFLVLSWIFLLQLLENQRTLELKIAIFCSNISITLTSTKKSQRDYINFFPLRIMKRTDNHRTTAKR
jgi:hypothetical protein